MWSDQSDLKCVLNASWVRLCLYLELYTCGWIPQNGLWYLVWKGPETQKLIWQTGGSIFVPKWGAWPRHRDRRAQVLLDLHIHTSRWDPFHWSIPASAEMLVLNIRDQEGSCSTYQGTESDFWRVLKLYIPMGGQCTPCFSCSRHSRRCAGGWAPCASCWGAWPATTAAAWWSGTRAGSRTSLETGNILRDSSKWNKTGDSKHYKQVCLVKLER